jgi:hypothetical protein
LNHPKILKVIHPLLGRDGAICILDKIHGFTITTSALFLTWDGFAEYCLVMDNEVMGISSLRSQVGRLLFFDQVCHPRHVKNGNNKRYAIA